MTLREVLAAARAALLPVAPTYLRDAMPAEGEDAPALPERFIILDLVTSPHERDFDGTIYSVVNLQVGCWSGTIADALDMLEAARQALTIAQPAWEPVRVHGTQTDPDTGHRGALADFTAMY